MSDHSPKVQEAAEAPRETRTVVLPRDRRSRFFQAPRRSKPTKNEDGRAENTANNSPDAQPPDLSSLNLQPNQSEQTDKAQQVFSQLEIMIDKRIDNLKAKLVAAAASSAGTRAEKFSKTGADEGRAPPPPVCKQPVRPPRPAWSSFLNPVISERSAVPSSQRIKRVSNSIIVENKAEEYSATDNNCKLTLFNGAGDVSKCYVVMYAKPSTRKHKIMEDDGFLIISGKDVTLKSSDGEVLASCHNFKLSEEMLTEQKIFNLGGKEVQILEPALKNPFPDHGESNRDNTFRFKTKDTEIVKLTNNIPFDGEQGLGSKTSSGTKPLVQVKHESKILKPAASNNLLEKCEDSSDDDCVIPTSQPVVVDKSIYYTAMFAKPSSRKRKVMENDGYVIVTGKTIILKNSNGEVIGTSHNLKLTDEMLTEQKIFHLGGKEVQILERTCKNENPFEKESGSSESACKPSHSQITEPSNKRFKGDPSSDIDFKGLETTPSGGCYSNKKDEKMEVSDDEESPILSSSVQAPKEVVIESKCYAVMYAKPSTRKHKVMENDGFIIVTGKTVVLKNSDGNVVGTSRGFVLSEEMLTEQKIFKLGGKEVQIVEPTDNPFGEDSTSKNSYLWNP